MHLHREAEEHWPLQPFFGTTQTNHALAPAVPAVPAPGSSLQNDPPAVWGSISSGLPREVL